MSFHAPTNSGKLGTRSQAAIDFDGGCNSVSETQILRGNPAMALIRKIVAAIAQIVALMLICAFSLYSGYYAWGWAKAVRFISDQLLLAAAELKKAGIGADLITPDKIEILVQVANASEPSVWFAIGTLLGFLFSVAIGSIVFMLAEIANNTRRMTQFFERLETRNRDPEPR